MSWVEAEVDGVTVEIKSAFSTDEWAAAKDTVIALMAAQLSDRLDMGDSIADSFADGGDVSGGVCTGGYVAADEPVEITVSPYTPDNTLEVISVMLMLQDVANTGALAVGDTSTDLIQAYLSYDGNSTFESALSFITEPYEFTSGSNIYVFSSDGIDVSNKTISSLGLKLQSFDRGSGAPAFRWHAYIIAGKEVA